MIDTDYEIIDMPSYNHSIVQANLAALIYLDYKEKYRVLTQPSITFGEWDAEPDLAIFQKRPVNWRKDEIKIKETPLAIIEIISPRQGQQELMDKLEKFFEAGVSSCWLINPLTETIWIYTPDWQKDIFSEMTPKVHDKTLDIKIDFKAIFS